MPDPSVPVAPTPEAPEPLWTTEYAVMCADGKMQRALDVMSAEILCRNLNRYCDRFRPCLEPHRVVQRIVSPWSPVVDLGGNTE